LGYDTCDYDLTTHNKGKRASVDHTVILGAIRILEDAFSVFLSLVPLAIIDGAVDKPSRRHIARTPDTQPSFSDLLKYNHNKYQLSLTNPRATRCITANVLQTMVDAQCDELATKLS